MAVVTNSMPCRLCGAPTIVPATRGEADVIRRWRRCPNGHQFVTREVFERDALPYQPGRGGRRAKEGEQCTS